VVALLEEQMGSRALLKRYIGFLRTSCSSSSFLREGATDPPDAINRIRDCLAPVEAAKAPLVWSRAVQLARASAGKSGQFDRARCALDLICRTPPRRDLLSPRPRQLTELAKSYVNLIPDDVGGTKLDRTSLLETGRQARGSPSCPDPRLPGSGKSVVVRRAVQRALERGPILSSS